MGPLASLSCRLLPGALHHLSLRIQEGLQTQIPAWKGKTTWKVSKNTGSCWLHFAQDSGTFGMMGFQDLYFQNFPSDSEDKDHPYFELPDLKPLTCPPPQLGL